MGRRTEGPSLHCHFTCPHCPREREATATMPKEQDKLESRDLPGPNDLQDSQGKFHLAKIFRFCLIWQIF